VSKKLAAEVQTMDDDQAEANGPKLRRFGGMFTQAELDTLDRAVSLRAALDGYAGETTTESKGLAVARIVAEWLSGQARKLAEITGADLTSC